MCAVPVTRPPSILDLARECKADAHSVTQRHKKHASFTLYRVLAKTLSLCERAERNPAERTELEELVLEATKAHKSRAYIERGSDIYIIACRYVFADDRGYANASRYAHCLRQARLRQLSSAGLFDWLSHHGGVNALYLARPLEARSVTTKSIRLSHSVELPKSGRFVLTLERLADGTFKPQEPVGRAV